MVLLNPAKMERDIAQLSARHFLEHMEGDTVISRYRYRPEGPMRASGAEVGAPGCTPLQRRIVPIRVASIGFGARSLFGGG